MSDGAPPAPGARWPALRDGVRFGMLLQLAVGPVCLFVLRTGSGQGPWQGLAAVAGVALVDALYIALAGFGVTRWAESGRARLLLRYGGAAIVAVFGLDVIASALGRSLLPGAAGLLPVAADAGPLLSAVLLTASNPLTIVFWAGVFGAKVASERYDRAQLAFFSLGCIVATVVFLAVVALAGALLGRLAPARALAGLNLAVGCALVYFAYRLARRRT